MNAAEDLAPSTPSGGRLWRRALYGLLALVLVASAVFYLGPRLNFGADQPTARAAPPSELDKLQAWLAAGEQAMPGVRDKTEKRIVWAGESTVRTPWSVVYVHGFSASRLETAPLAELVAKGLGANLFETRLTGHGQGYAAMGDASAQDWLADVQEAARIGALLGERVLILSCSTGSTLGAWLSMQTQGPSADAQVFVSPNFGPRDKRSDLLIGPWGEQLAYAIAGQSYGKASADPREDLAWTSPYPTKALFPMMLLVQKVRESDLSRFTTPVLMFYSEADQTVDPVFTKDAFARLGSATKSLVPVSDSASQGQHVLVGDIRAPKSTEPMAAAILKWVEALPKRP